MKEKDASEVARENSLSGFGCAEGIMSIIKRTIVQCIVGWRWA